MVEAFGISPEVIVTDKNQALMSAICVVFPNAANLLCIWHIEKNVLANTRRNFVTDREHQIFMETWVSICHSTSKEIYEEKWKKFKEIYRESESISYIESTWIRGHKKRFIKA